MSHCKVTVVHPVLTEKERERRMNQIKKATVEFLRAVEKERAEKEETKHGRNQTG